MEAMTIKGQHDRDLDGNRIVRILMGWCLYRHTHVIKRHTRSDNSVH